MLPSLVAADIRTTLLAYLTTTFNLQDERLEQALLAFLEDREQGIFKGPYVNVQLPFARAEKDDFGLTITPPFVPYQHQARAWRRLASGSGQPQPTLITTGTGSGKTECFLYPILDDCYRRRDEPGIKAIILYPMNALAGDQANRLAQIIAADERLHGLRAGLYIGGRAADAGKTMQSDRLIDDRAALRRNPPDILLTNYKMLDFLLLRPQDRALWQNNGPQTLRYLVLDELHTYDGAQGSDVACLLRRLRARLDADKGTICPIGTSATVGEESAAGRQALIEFANQIFGVEFGVDSVIGETRLSTAAFLPNRATRNRRPSPAAVAAVSDLSLDETIERHSALWFGDDADAGPIRLGELLAEHQLLHDLLAQFGSRIATLDDIGRRLGVAPPVLASFLTLLSAARQIDNRRVVPFVTVQIQLWVREISRLLRELSAEPRFFFLDDRPASQPPHGLPIVVCRECGVSGWLAGQRPGDDVLEHSTGVVYRFYFDRSRHTRYLFPVDTFDEQTQQVCPACLHVTLGDACAHCGTPTLPVLLHYAHGEASDGRPPRDLRRCPHCRADDAFVLLGSQAASLASVAIGHLFTTRLNHDKKLLAFTDSVQDASHRAAFFAARTYRFGLRTAMQQVLQESDSLPLDAENFLDALWQQWLAYFQLQQGESRGRQRFVAVMTPPDLRDWQPYQAYLAESGGPIPPELAAGLRSRLLWELLAEYGFNARTGRTLERAGASVVALDRQMLAKATDAAYLTLTNELVALEDRTKTDVHHLIAGLLTRTRLRGGVTHPWLDDYAYSNGSGFELSQRRKPLLTPFGPRLPRFITTRRSRGAFDLLLSGSGETWFSDWARRVLDLRSEGDIVGDIYSYLLPILVDHGLLERFALTVGSVYGVRRQALRFDVDATELRCDSCGQEHIVPAAELADWTAQPCMRFRCPGVYQPQSGGDGGYYRRRYANGQVERIFAHEHTGLLERDLRERIETLFRSGARADAPNLLVATPTLEMGIDIGDLSATLATSIPPSPANYLQRIGRAGRKTGNALVVALANARPHDLYFYAEPLQMLHGAIVPPGCFLDAPRMLERQLLAFSLDDWTRGHGARQGALPASVKKLLSVADEPDSFPQHWLRFFDAQRPQLLARFLDLFGDVVSARNQQRLRETAAELPLRVRRAIADVRAELKTLRSERERLGRDVKRIESDPHAYQNPDFEINRLQQERQVIAVQIKQIERKYILNFFTDSGLLPNYAFPEEGVTLDVQISGVPSADGPPAIERQQYTRPAPLALRELAPHNFFYALHRKAPITHLDVSGQDDTIEQWQFCPRCSHVEQVHAHGYQGHCPSCGSSMWADSGQQHAMIRLRRVRSISEHGESLAGDDAEDRVRRFYETEHFFDIAADASNGAHLVRRPLFGLEYLHDITLREVNFGLRDPVQQTIPIADQPRPAGGFAVCPSCGVVLDPQQPDKVNHTRRCSEVGRPEGVRWQQLYLYRELATEALRILLPVSTMLVEEKLATMQAALQLGLREKFGGRADHLRILPYSEVTTGGDRRRFLIIYDTVPGGTSFLRDLARPAVFGEVLQLAHEQVANCRCRSEPDKTACYHCLYTYQAQYALHLIQRALAEQMIGAVLANWHSAAPLATLSTVAVDEVIESELEQKFIDALERHARMRADGDWQPLGGQQRWRLQLGGRRWIVEPQKLLDADDNVMIATRCDFLFTPEHSAGKRIAVYLDGAQYHIQPGDAHGRIGDDVAKRSAIVESGQLISWTLTWDDVVAFESGHDLPLIAPPQLQFVGRMFAQMSAPLAAELINGNAMRQLIQLLAEPTAKAWQQLAFVLCLSQISMEKRPPIAEAQLSQLRAALLSAAQPPPIDLQDAPAGDALYRVVQQNGLTQLLYIAQSALAQNKQLQMHAALHLDDSHDRRQRLEFKETWRKFWRWFDMLQFLPYSAAAAAGTHTA